MKPFPVANLGPLTSLISSGSTPLGGSSRYLAEGPVMFIRSQNVRMNCLDISDVVYIDSVLHEEMKRTHVRSGDVFINITGASIGRVAAFDRNGDRANVNQHVCIIRPKPELLDFRYLTTYLCSPPFQEIINRLQRGGTRQALTFDMIANFDIPLPPLPEQRRIAAILDRADCIRRKREESIRLAEELLRSTFLEMFGDPATSPSNSLDELAEVVSGVTKGRKLNGTTVTVPYLRVANVQDGYLNLDEIKTIEALPAEVTSLSLQHGDIVMTEGGDFDKLGRGAIWAEPLSNCIHQNHVFRVRVNRKHLLPSYFAAFLRTTQAKAYFLRCAKKTTNLASINMTQLRGLPVPVPPLALQFRFEKAANAISDMCDLRKKATGEAKELFGSLVQRAFRGEL